MRLIYQSNKTILMFFLLTIFSINVMADDSKNLFEAIKKKDINQVKILVNQKSNLKQTKDGVTPLHLAINEKYTDAIEILLKNGADPNSRDKNRRTPLMAAVKKASPKMIEYLLKNGAKPNLMDKNGYTALIYAAVNGDNLCVETLIDNGAKVNFKNNHWYTALMLAAASGHLSTVQLLLKKGADPNIKDELGQKASIWAEHFKRKEIKQILKEAEKKHKK